MAALEEIISDPDSMRMQVHKRNVCSVSMRTSMSVTISISVSVKYDSMKILVVV